MAGTCSVAQTAEKTRWCIHRMDRFNCIQRMRHVLDLNSGRIDQTDGKGGGDMTKHISAATKSCGQEFSGPRLKCFVERVDCKEGDQRSGHTRNWWLCSFCIKVRLVSSSLNNKNIFRKLEHYRVKTSRSTIPQVTVSRNLCPYITRLTLQPIRIPPSR